MITIRKLQVDEIESAIAVIHRASRANKKDYPDDFIDLLNEQHYNVNWLQTMLERKDFFVAIVDDVIAGTVSTNNDEIVNVFVDYELQRKGVGKALMSHIEQELCAKGYHLAKLSANLTSLPFYEAIGYTRVKRRVEQVQSWEVVAFDMEKQLEC